MQRGVNFLQLSDGLRLAFKEWGANNPRRVLALHGWLDNANSFDYLGPFLAEKGFHVLAVDHVGHGLSDHLGQGAAYSILKTTSCLTDFVHALGWQKFHLLGHSMGASMALIFSATMTEFVDRLVLVEGFGPVTLEPSETARNLRKAFDSERQMRLKNTPPKPYFSFTAAVEARLRAVATYPGQQFLSPEAAAILVARGARLVEEGNETGDYVDLNREEQRAVCFRHDKRLVLPSFLYHTDDQVMAYIHSITASTLFISGTHGWPMPAPLLAQRAAALSSRGLLSQRPLAGSHHLHLDPDHRQAVGEAVLTFLTKV